MGRRRKAPAPDVDSKWFKDRLADQQLSARKAGMMVGLDATALAKVFAGTRRLQMGESVALARILRVPIDELLKHAGMQPAASRRAIRISQFADHGGLVGSDAPANGGPRTIEPPPGVPCDTAAVALRIPNSVADGWVAFYAPTARLEPEAVGRLAVVGLKNGKRYLRVLEQGFEHGRWDLVAFAPGQGVPTIRGVVVAWAAPVLWLRT